MKWKKLYWLEKDDHTYVWHCIIKSVDEQPKYQNCASLCSLCQGKEGANKIYVFSWITGIKFNMLLIIFFGLVATLTSGSGGCGFGTQDVNGFDFSRAGAGALAWFVEQTVDNVSAWFVISFVVLLTKLNRSDQIE